MPAGHRQRQTIGLAPCVPARDGGHREDEPSNPGQPLAPVARDDCARAVPGLERVERVARIRGLGRLHWSQYGEIPGAPRNEAASCGAFDEIGGTMSEGSDWTAESLESTGFVDFLRTGQPAAGEVHCSGCGYGVVVEVELPRCPM